MTGSDSVLVAWPFEPIDPRSRHTVRVRVTGSDGRASAWSEPLEVVAAFLATDEWAAPMIGLEGADRIAQPALLRTDGAQFLADRELHEEIFGPVSVIVAASDYMELERVAESLEGQLTATIHGTPEELHSHARLVEILTRKVGRLLFNGFPTGVEVGHAMQHGGPYPASSDSRMPA